MPPKLHQTRLPAHEVDRYFVTSKVQFLQDIHLWPARNTIDSSAWLKNFSKSEQPYALNLLNVFLYYNDALIDALLEGAVQQLSSIVVPTPTDFAHAQAQWRAFLHNLVITYVEGEEPNPTDSGYIFARKARQVLGISEDQIKPPKEALQLIMDDPETAVIFVDDFVGSGNQIINTWTREYVLGGRTNRSFRSIATPHSKIFYVPVIATTYGLSRLQCSCDNLNTYPAHALSDDYSLISPNSVLWPDHLKPNAISFLYESSARAGITGDPDANWKGFHDLGLSIAFAHSVPDATIPLFWWSKNEWSPLKQRR